MSKRNIDYAFKSYVLKEHAELLKKQKRASLYDYSLNEFFNNGVVLYALKTNKDYYNSYTELVNYCIENDLMKELRECLRINHAERERTKRLKERIEAMLLNGKCLFLTLTFTDSTLAETTQKERRVAVVRYLKKFNAPYVANIDFGKDETKTMREHYHAVIQCDKIEFEAWRKYGNINAKVVRNRNINDDKTKLAKYVSKLSNHAIKETTRRSSLIYSR